MRFLGKVLVYLVAAGTPVVVGLFLFAHFVSDAAPRRTDCWAVDEDDALHITRTFVERTLTSPKSAEHPSDDDYGVSAVRADGVCSFTVRSHVDAQNGFGVLIRSRFTAVVTYKAPAELWRLDTLRFTD